MINPATPLPFRISSLNPDLIISEHENKIISIAKAVHWKDAAYIVTACNEFPALVAGLKYFMRNLESKHYSDEVAIVNITELLNRCGVKI